VVVTTATTAPAVTTTTRPVTTTRPPTTVPRTTTTAVITDATKADRRALTAQLQAVVDRYQALYLLSRSSPHRPFDNAQLVDAFSQIASRDVLARLIQNWQQFRAQDSAARLGPSKQTRLYITNVDPGGPLRVVATYCGFDDAILYRVSDGAVLDNKAYIGRGQFDFELKTGRWMVTGLHVSGNVEVPVAAQNPCPTEAR
jgi:hypothetical protein